MALGKLLRTGEKIRKSIVCKWRHPCFVTLCHCCESTELHYQRCMGRNNLFLFDSTLPLGSENRSHSSDDDGQVKCSVLLQIERSFFFVILASYGVGMNNLE